MGKYMGGVRCNITQIKKYTHLCNMLKDFATNIWIPTLTAPLTRNRPNLTVIFISIVPPLKGNMFINVCLFP